MGRKNRNMKKKQKPFVSLCTPTFNRRPFVESMIKCFEHQTYPKDKMEWIIIDDGTDPIEDLVKDIPEVKYFKYDEKMVLGKKRNIMHEKSKGDIIVYMDDDDYYPPQRVSHAVEMLQSSSKALCAGSSEIYIYFKHIDEMWQFGPYAPRHATAGTFAFKRELLEEHRYSDEAALAEEKAFLKNYTVPFVQLDPKKVILVFSHDHNTFDKKKLIAGGENKFVKKSDKVVDDFVKEADLKEFYTNELHPLLDNYEPGKPVMKQDVMEQTKQIEETRQKQHEEMIAQQQKQHEQTQGIVTMRQADGSDVKLSLPQVVNIMQQQQDQINKMNKFVQTLQNEILELKTKNSELYAKVELGV